MLLNSKILNNVKKKKKNKIKNINLNFGPNHPAAHGVLRLILGMDGEIVKNADVHIGLLHRGTEKLIEDRIYLLSLPYFDRLDYVSMMVQEHAYCLAVEKLKKFPNFNQKIIKIRTIFDELTRILNHLLAIACHALDVGSMSPIFWAFEERENIMSFYEQVSGARMHAAYYRPGRTNSNLTENLLQSILNFTTNCQQTLTLISGVLSENTI
jgi:NADH:ubiquinone oxidoreductase subunit D